MNLIYHIPIFFLLGFFSAGFGVYQLFREIRPRYWKQAPGRIVSAKIEEKLVELANGNSTSVFVPVIEFEYEHLGRIYKSTLVNMGNFFSGRLADAEAAVARYPVTTTVRVSINQKRPTQAVLEYGTTSLSWIPLILGLILLATAIAVAPNP